MSWRLQQVWYHIEYRSMPKTVVFCLWGIRAETQRDKQWSHGVNFSPLYAAHDSHAPCHSSMIWGFMDWAGL